MPRATYLGVAVGVVALAAALRAATLGAGFPYYSYVDEGHVLRPAAHMVALGTWDPGFYRYPSLLPEAIAAAAAAAAPVYARVTGRSLSAAARRSSPRHYDVVEPPLLLALGRGLVWAASVATVAVTIALGTRLAGRRAGLAAGLLAAVAPALVGRGAIAIVDTPAALFATLALLLAVPPGGTPLGAGRAALAGAAAGLAATAKYTAGAVLAAVGLVIAGTPAPWARRVRLGLAAAAGAAGAAALAMPALWLRSGEVAHQLAFQQDIYARYPPTPSYLAAALDAGELGVPFLLAAVLGLASLLAAPRTRAVAVGWCAFAALLLVVLLGFRFQPFRNLLPLVPFACVAAGAGIARLDDLVAARGARRGVAWTVVAAALAGTMLVTGTLPAVAARARLVDTRTAARAWLEAHVRPGERVLVVEELAMLPSELERLGVPVAIVPWAGAPAALARGRWDWVVGGDGRTLGGDAAWAAALAGRPLRLRVGEAPMGEPNTWRGNREAVLVYGPPT
jgi:hypothetical protein